LNSNVRTDPPLASTTLAWAFPWVVHTWADSTTGCGTGIPLVRMQWML
jgi:hypothetical protein